MPKFSRIALTVIAVLACVLLMGAGTGDDAQRVISTPGYVTVNAASTTIDIKTLSAMNTQGVSGWEFDNADADDAIECQTDPAKPDPAIGLANQLRVRADTVKSVYGLVLPDKIRCISAGDGATLRIEGLKR